MIVIGITGGIGCGKSFVGDYMSEKYNALILKADDIAHDVYEPGAVCYEKLIQVLGEECLNNDGTFDRKKISAKIFSDPEALAEVNSVVHPAVRKVIEDAIAEEAAGGGEIVLVEAALLIESGYRDFCDEYWYVYADKDVRIQRLTSSRGMTGDAIEAVMRKQLDEEKFRSECDYTVDNSGNFEKTAREIEERIAYLKSRH